MTRQGQRDCSLVFKLPMVQQVEKGELTAFINCSTFCSALLYTNS
jgi:hypothetical protein